jgi:methylated-DNA-[protein]-cysteine S-methyltransferase
MIFEKIKLRKNIIKKTPFGPVAVIWSQLDGFPKIISVLISKPEQSAEEQATVIYPYSHSDSCLEIDAISDDIKSFLEGELVNFSLDMVALDICSPFQQAVLRAEYQIPRGSVSTYQLIARYLGKEKGARAVGNALARNPFPIIIPCHRAIRSDGSLGGFQGGMDMKRALLENEGIKFDKGGKVISFNIYY